MRSLFGDWLKAYRSSVDQAFLHPRYQRLILGAILLLCLGVRLWTLRSPALDRTNWKEIDYITISSNYWHHGYHFLQPQIDWPADPHRVTAMEFPLVPYVTALLYPVLGFNVFSVRWPTLFAFLLLIVYVFRLVKRELGPMQALLAALACSIMPLYHQYGRFLYSDPLMIALSVAALFHFAEWVEGERSRDGMLAVMCFSLAVALKLEPLYLLLPLFWIAFRKYRWEWKRYGRPVAMLLGALILPLAWYAYAYHLAHTSIDVFGVFGGLGHSGHNKFQSWLMLRERQWYIEIAQRLIAILAGKVGVALVLVGMLAALVARRAWFFFCYLASIGFYFALVAEGQIDTSYRQLAIIPVFAVFLALGASAIGAGIVAFGRYVSRRPSGSQAVAMTFLIGALLISLMAYRRRSDILFADPRIPADQCRWELAHQIKKFAPPGSTMVVAGEYSLNHGGNDLSPMLYYYSGLRGWTIQRGQWHLRFVQSFISQGASFFAAIQMSREPDSAPFLEEMRSHYRVLYEGDDELLLDLRQPVSK